MSNFAFVKAALPEVHGDCATAESYLATDSRSACFYARRTIERLVGYLYDLLDLPEPYQTDLAARVNAGRFKAVAGTGITQKLNLIRKVGNTAVHDSKPIPNHAALQVLRDLHHIMVWAVFHHSTTPALAPTQAQFDPSLAAKAAPLSHAEVVKLAEKFAAQDAAHAKALEEKDALAAAKDAEIAELKAQVRAAQAANAGTDDRDYDEADTRDAFIDVLLREAGWPLSDARDLEFEVHGMPNEQGVGYVDYVLWGLDGLPLAVVEAKRTRVSAQVGQRQAELYADCLESTYGRRPVIFYTNGQDHWIWDDANGYPPRPVRGFYTRDELELLIQRRQTRLDLATLPIDKGIVERYYQERAIRAVDDAFTGKQREALLVMATGSGKTRTVIALVDQLMRANWVKRVLFLADRTALVNQATRAFNAHLPSATTVNLVTEKKGDGRVYVSTYQTMLNLINEVDDQGRRFGPGYFDLIVIDEAHRSVYARYGAIFDWFDSLLVGLTATPRDEIDRNTYRLFHLEDGVPTDSYGLDEAVADGFLVPPKGYALGTEFLRRGIRYDDLSQEEKDQWDGLDWGDDGPPEEVGSEEINRVLFNADTVDKVIATLMADGYKVASGDRIGKTIIFAMNRKHAELVEKQFNLAYPDLAGKTARMITHDAPYAQSLIDEFSDPNKPLDIAISVDMLDTGIDVPEVVNLVFFKPVMSKVKFWQMIGRGTRLSPDLYGPGQHKEDFLVLDFCGNLEFFSQDLPGSEGSTQKSLTQRIVEARIGLVAALGETEPDLRSATADELHNFVSGMTLDNVLVRPHRRAIEHFSDRTAWDGLGQREAEAALALAGLPSTKRDTDEDAKRFDLLVLRRQLAQLENDAVTAERIRETVQGIATALLAKTAIPSVKEQADLIEAVASDDWWVDITLPLLEVMRLRLRSLVGLIEKTHRNPVYSDFEDALVEARQVDLPRVTPGTDPQRFKAKARAYLRSHEGHVALQRLRRNRPLTSEDLTALEAILVEAGGDTAAISAEAEQAGGLGLFVRALVGLDREAAVEAFANYLDGGRFSVEQIRFVELIIDELTANGTMDPGRLYESPYVDHGAKGIDSHFPEDDVNVIVEILREVRSNAVPVPA